MLWGLAERKKAPHGPRAEEVLNTQEEVAPAELNIFFKFIFAVLGVEANARCMLGKFSTAELHPSPPELEFCSGLYLANSGGWEGRAR
jgi:hypothetical protein